VKVLIGWIDQEHGTVETSPTGLVYGGPEPDYVHKLVAWILQRLLAAWQLCLFPPLLYPMAAHTPLMPFTWRDASSFATTETWIYLAMSRLMLRRLVRLQ
jgi:hypothetical protein